MKSAPKYKVGDKFRVKHTAILCRYGVNVTRQFGTDFERRVDCKAWPGEIGTVEGYTYFDRNGDPVEIFRLVFERTRTVSCDSVDWADLVKVKNAT